MNRVSVSSSNLASVDYNAAHQVLEIAFLRGGVYQYFGVPSSVYQGLTTASSHGMFFDLYIKKAGWLPLAKDRLITAFLPFPCL